MLFRKNKKKIEYFMGSFCYHHQSYMILMINLIFYYFYRKSAFNKSVFLHQENMGTENTYFHNMGKKLTTKENEANI